jgi:hypothetical protein
MAELTQAVALARRLPIFPCSSETKRPLTVHGFKDSSQNAELVRDWWTRCPDALIGVPTGARFIVVDVDMQHADAEKWWHANKDRVPLTRTHATRSGGFHLLFRPDARIPCSQSRIAPHIDTRAFGGYVIWWPAESIGRDAPVEHGRILAPLPDCIAAIFSPQAPRVSTRAHPSTRDVTAAVEGIVGTIAAAQEGNRNGVLFWGACRLAENARDGRISEASAQALALEAARQAGLPDAEANRTIFSAFSRA